MNANSATNLFIKMRFASKLLQVCAFNFLTSEKIFNCASKGFYVKEEITEVNINQFFLKKDPSCLFGFMELKVDFGKNSNFTDLVLITKQLIFLLS